MHLIKKGMYMYYRHSNWYANLGTDINENLAVGNQFLLGHQWFFLNPCRARHDSSDGQEIL